ncbi:MAG: transposase [Thermoguttaceae bacterium]|nr:transposase [Thermoguttaceae bacterium]
MRKENQHKGRYKSHHLPHWDYPDAVQFITYRLWDSLPKKQADIILEKVALVPEERKRVYMGHLMDEWLNTGYGCGFLTAPDVYPIILEDWFHNNNSAYELLEWVIMPNHVHLLIRQYAGYSLQDIIHNWKGYSCRKIIETASFKRAIANNPSFTSDSIWFPNYYDRAIRGSGHYYNTRKYILNNPVGLKWNAKTVQSPQDWPLSSATEQWKELLK